MNKTFEVQISQEFLKRMEQDVEAHVKSLDMAGAFTAYNRGGGPGGAYDRHYDRSTGISEKAGFLSL